MTVHGTHLVSSSLLCTFCLAFAARGGRASMSMMSVLSEMRKLESFAKHRRRTEYLNYSLLTASATLLLTSQKKSN